MSFLVKQPQLPQGAAGADPKLSSDYRAAEVVPMGWGREVFAGKFVSDKYDVHTQRAGDNKPEWQYCSIAAVYRRGPIDFVGFVFMGGKGIASLDYTFGPSEESHEFTINPSLASGRAFKVIVHRGTEDADAAGVANLRTQTGQQHPPMRGWAWAEWVNIDLGQSTALPSLALEMGKHAPEIDAFPGGDSHPYGVNPFAAIYDLLQDATGGDFDGELLDAEHWGAQALALEDEGVSGRTGNLVHCHPTFSAATSIGDAISQILAYVDGYVFAREGKLCVGWFPSAAVDAGTLPEIAEGDLEAKPGGGGFPDWNEGATSVVVVFKSFDKDYGNDAARYNAPANRENNVTAEPVTKQRPFIHAADQAAMIAAEGATESSSGEISTSLTVFKSRAVNGDDEPLMPGDLVNWDYAPHSLDLVCRVTARRMRMGAASDVLTLTRERGAYPRPYVAAIDDRVLPTADDPGEIDTADVRFWLMPSGLTELRRIAPLINRSKRTIYRADIHLSTAGAAPWETILDSRFFSAKGAVNNAGINSSVTTVRISSTSVDFARMAAQNAVGQADDTLLLLIDDELMSVSTIATVSSNVYDLGILRGRRGTTAAAHSLAAVIWLFLRAEIDSVEHEEFYHVRDGSNVYDVTTATKYFKVQLFTSAVDGVAKPDDPGISKVFPDLAPAVPTSLSVTARTGFNEIRWTQSVTPTVETHFVYRNTVNDATTATKIGENDGDFFHDSTAVPTTVYWYWVTAVDDGTESARTAAGTVTTLTAALLGLLPSNPTAATKTDEGTRLGNDGTVYAWFEFSVPALPANAKWQNIEVKAGTSTEYETKAQLTNTGTTDCIIENLIPGESYDVRTRAFSGAGPSAGVAVTSSPFTAPTDSTVPPAPGSLTVTARPGFNQLKWDASTDKDMVAGEYHVYRNTVDNAGTASEIGVTKDVQFADPAPTPGTTQWYYVASEDPSENLGSKTTGVSVVTAPDPVDDVTPSDPTAATKSGEGVRQSTDGVISAYFEMSIPALPANALYQNVEARVNVSAEYEIKAQLKNTSTATVRIENLIPGQVYQVAVRAWSASRPSNLVAATTSPFTAPGDTTGPNAPTGTGGGGSWQILAGNEANANIFPRTYGSPPSLMYACRIKYVPSTSTDIAFYECQTTTVDTDGAASLICDVSGTEYAIVVGVPYFDYWNQSQAGPRYMRFRGVDWTGNRGAWARVGEIATSAWLQLPAGNMMLQNKSAVDLTGGQAILGGLEANVTTAVDVKSVNLRVYDSGGTQRARVNNATGDHYVNNLKVLGSQMTGWGAPTGTATRSAFATSTVTTEQLAERVKALVDDLGATGGHGLIDR